MPQVWDTYFIGKLLAIHSAIIAQIGTFRKNEQPHGIFAMVCRKLLQAMCNPGLILFPFSSHEYEAVELHSDTKEWYIFQRLFQDDIDISMHSSGIRHPPKVKPVRVELKTVSIHDMQSEDTVRMSDALGGLRSR